MTAPQQPGPGPDAANRADQPQSAFPGSSDPARPSDPMQGRHSVSGEPGVPTEVSRPDATQVISSALEGGRSGGAQPSDPSSDATQVVGTPGGGFPPPGSPGGYGGAGAPGGYGGPAQGGPGGYQPPSPAGYPPPGQQPYGAAPSAPGGPGAAPSWPSAEPPRPPQAQPQPPQGMPPQAPPPPPGWAQQQPGPYAQPQQPGPYGAPPPSQQQWGQQQGQYGQPGPYGAQPQQQWGQQPGQYGQQYPQQNNPFSNFGGPATRSDYAEWQQRAIGGLIDYGLPFGGAFILYIILGILAANVSGFFALLAFLVWLGAIGFVLWNSYQGGETGQTIGRKYAKVKLIKEDTGQPIGGGMGIVRYIAHALEFGIGWFAPLFTPKKQTFADMILGTVVVRADDSRG